MDERIVLYVNSKYGGIDEGEKWFSNLSAQFKQCALCTILSHCTKCAMLDGKRMKQPPKQSDFNQPSVTFLCFGCPMPVRSLPTSRADFIPCDSFMQRAYCLLTYGHPKIQVAPAGLEPMISAMVEHYDGIAERSWVRISLKLPEIFRCPYETIGSSKARAFLRRGRQPEENILLARTVASLRILY